MDDVEQIVLDTVRKVFADEFTQDDLRRAANGDFLADKWRLVEELGLPLALAGGADGELGLETLSALKIVRLAAYHAIPLPLAETMFANYLLERAGLPTRTTPMSVAPAHRLDTISIEEAPGGEWSVAGSARAVPWARDASAIVVVARHGARPHIAVVEPGEWDVAGEAVSLTGAPANLLSFSTRVPASRVASLPDDVSPDIAILGGAAIRAIGLAGTLEQILGSTVAFVNDRVQFGKALGKFQAIQHGMAQLAEQSVAASAAADLAAEAFAGNASSIAIAAAKSRAGEAAGIAANLSHQIHGAIGVTEEYLLHHLTKQAWAWRDEFGNEAHWNEQLGHAFLSAGADRLWSEITAV